jgi:hypothetical protein
MLWILGATGFAVAGLVSDFPIALPVAAFFF